MYFKYITFFFTKDVKLAIKVKIISIAFVNV